MPVSRNSIACVSALALTLLATWTTEGVHAIHAEATQQENKQTKQPDQTPITAVVLEVIADVYPDGFLYAKRLELSHRGAKYTLAYSCGESKASSGECACKKLKGEVAKNVAEQYFEEVAKLPFRPDATCCDHPYTNVSITYLDGSKKHLAVAFDALGYRKEDNGKEVKILGLTCQKAKQ